MHGGGTLQVHGSCLGSFHNAVPPLGGGSSLARQACQDVRLSQPLRTRISLVTRSR